MFRHVFLSQPQNDDLSDNKQRCSKHPRCLREVFWGLFFWLNMEVKWPSFRYIYLHKYFTPQISQVTIIIICLPPKSGHHLWFGAPSAHPRLGTPPRVPTGPESAGLSAGYEGSRLQPVSAPAMGRQKILQKRLNPWEFGIFTHFTLRIWSRKPAKMVI